MVVRIAIRPRLVLTPERVVARPRLRLPPLALPAAAYWLAMGGLTYAFMQLEPRPLGESPPSGVRDEVEGAGPAEALEPFGSELSNRAPAPPFRSAEPAPPTAALDEGRPEPAAESSGTKSSAGGTEAASTLRRNAEQVPHHPGSARGSEDHAASYAPSMLALPEFTDSSRSTPSGHAADGPRIASLFESADHADSEPTLPLSAERGAGSTPAFASCEAAMARNSELLNIGGPRGAPDISREAYASLLENGAFLTACPIADRSVLEICAAVKEGQLVGITVVSSPSNPRLNACVKRAVARLKFPSSARLDVTHTRFGGAGH